MKVVDYKLVSSYSRDGIQAAADMVEEEVKSLLADGWQPMGAAKMTCTVEDCNEVMQTMVKYAP